MLKKLLSLLLLACLLVGCAAGQALPATNTALVETQPPSPSPLPTDTPVPTQIPAPTDTPTPLPTKTPKPSPTATATVAPPAILGDFLNNVKVLVVDGFDSKRGGWQLDAGVISGGVLQVRGNENWNGLLYGRRLNEGQGAMIDFRYNKNPEFEVLLDYGDWWTDPYRRLGVYFVDTAYSNLWQGKVSVGEFRRLGGSLRLKPDEWYSLAIVAIEGGELMALVWNPAQPDQFLKYHERIGNTWSGLSWTFRIGANQGQTTFDNFAIIAFEGLAGQYASKETPVK